MIKRSFIMSLLLLAGFMFGCEKEPPLSASEKLKKDIEEIERYLETNSLTAVKDESGLFYTIHEIGDGTSINFYSEINVMYEGRYMKDEKVLDSKNSFTTMLYDTVEGWRIGLPKIKKGGKITLYIPGGLAYGKDILIFDIEVKDVYL